MSNQILPMADSAQPWIEKISGMEEEIRNLRRLQHTIERNNTLFEALLASSYDGITLTRLDGTIIKVVRAILGYSPDLSGTSCYNFVHPTDREQLSAAYRLLGQRLQPRAEVELRLIRPDQSPVWVEMTLTDMLDNPAVQAIVLNYRNVARLRANELAAAELEVVSRYTAFAVFSRNVSGEILTWNERARELFGHSQHEILGRHVWTLIPPAQRETEQLHRSYVIERKTATGKIRTVALHKDGAHLPMELVLFPILTDGLVNGIAQLSFPLDRPC